MDGWYLGDSRGWFGSIFSVDSPPHWAIVCNLKAELTSMLCSNHPPLLKSLASLQPAIAFYLVPSCDPHRTLGMKSAKNKWPLCTGHRNWGLPGQWCCQAWTFRLASPGFHRYLSFHRLLLSSQPPFHRLLLSSQPPAGRGAHPPQLSRFLSLKLWLTRNTQAWHMLGSQMAHIEPIVKWVKLSKGTGCFWDHMWVDVWRTGKGICMKAPVWLYCRIQNDCLPTFLFRVTNTQAHDRVIVIYWTEAAYNSYLRNSTNIRPIEQWLRSYLLLLLKYSQSLVIWPYLSTCRQSGFKISLHQVREYTSINFTMGIRKSSHSSLWFPF